MTRRGTRYAAILCFAYVLAAGAYIVLSGRMAATAAASIDDLRRSELLKGLGFVAVTGAALFVLAASLFRRLASSQAELSRAREALLVADRRATPGLLAASIAHDFNNILMVLSWRLDELRASSAGADSEITDSMAAATAQGRSLARRLSQAGRGAASGAAAEVDLAQLVTNVVQLLRFHPSARQRQLLVAPMQPFTLRAYPALVEQILTNLLVNALDATPEHGTVTVRVAPTEGGASIEVHDSGPGIAATDRDALFEPFYTTKPDGTGLGLVSVRTCAEAHGGSVEIDRSEELGGACLRVLLGRLDPGQSEGSAAS